jgi:hypothetical protein
MSRDHLNNSTYWIGNRGGDRALISITLKQDGELYRHTKRIMTLGGKPTDAIRKMLSRYVELIDSIPTPPGEIVRSLYGVLDYASAAYVDIDDNRSEVSLNPKFSYPKRHVVLKRVRDAPIPLGEKDSLAGYLEKCSPQEYMKLIECISSM